MTGDISKHHAISLKSYKWSMKVESSPSRKERLDIDFSLNELQLKWAIHSWKHESVDQKAGSLVPGQLHWCREDHTDRTYCKCQEPSEPKKTEGSISCSNHVGFHRPGSLKRMVGPEDSRMVSRHWTCFSHISRHESLRWTENRTKLNIAKNNRIIRTSSIYNY